MSVVVIVGSGMMGSALAVPLCENGHTVRLVGSPLDDAIIAHGQKANEHLTLKRKMPEQVQWSFPRCPASDGWCGSLCEWR